MREWGDEILRHKYDPLPDEPRHRKRARRRHVRSDHRHDYEDVRLVVRGDGHRPSRDLFYGARRCRVCGRLQDVSVPPEDEPRDMPLYELRGFEELFTLKEIGEERAVSE